MSRPHAWFLVRKRLSVRFHVLTAVGRFMATIISSGRLVVKRHTTSRDHHAIIATGFLYVRSYAQAWVPGHRVVSCRPVRLSAVRRNIYPPNTSGFMCVCTIVTVWTNRLRAAPSTSLPQPFARRHINPPNIHCVFRVYTYDGPTATEIRLYISVTAYVSKNNAEPDRKKR